MTLRTLPVLLLCTTTAFLAQTSAPSPSSGAASIRQADRSAGSLTGGAHPAAKGPAFEVASVKLDKSCDNRPMMMGPSEISPVSYSQKCISIKTLIREAYAARDGSQIREPPDVLGGPNWLDTDKYDIFARAERPTPSWQMYSAMIPALLEDRFHLRLHTEARDTSVFLMTLTGDKPKFKPTAGCTPRDPEHPSPGPVWDPKTGRYIAPAQRECGSMQAGIDGPNRVATWYGVSMADFANWCIPARVGRPVVDKTGLPGLFDIQLEYSPDTTNPQMPDGFSRYLADRGLAPPTRAVNEQPGIFEAIEQQLGLKLTAGKAPVDYFVIDHVERPSEN